MILPELTELIFDEATHTYSINGILLPSVTTLMKPLSNAYYNGIDSEKLHIAADRGTAIHNAIDNYNRFGIIDLPSELAGYFQAYKAWEQDYKPEIYTTEYRLYHKYLRYSGTADMICSIKGEDTLIDFKSSVTVSDRLTAVQLAAYANALLSHKIKVTKAKIVQLRSDGEYKEYDHDPYDNAAWAVFGSLISIDNYIKKI